MNKKSHRISVSTCMCLNMHMYVYIYVYICTYMCTHTLIHVLEHTNIHIHERIHKHTYTYIYRAHTHTHTHTRTHTHSNAHTCWLETNPTEYTRQMYIPFKNNMTFICNYNSVQTIDSLCLRHLHFSNLIYNFRKWWKSFLIHVWYEHLAICWAICLPAHSFVCNMSI